LAFVGLLYSAILDVGDTGQDMLGLAVAVLAAEEDVGPEDRNGHCIQPWFKKAVAWKSLKAL
jgi:hypothetical protein